MAIADDFEIQQDKDIRYTGSTANYTVLAFHEWLRLLATDASGTPDDHMDITKADPSDKSFDTIINLVNGFNIDDTAAQHLYGGSIIQTGGAEIWDGINIAAPAGVYVYVLQSGANLTPNFWTTGLNPDANAGLSHQFMLKVRTAGADIDGRRMIFVTREFNYLYQEYIVNGSGRGINVVPFPTWKADTFNQVAAGSMTSSPYSDVALDTVGYFAQDTNQDTVDEYYYGEWDLNGSTVRNGYERWKYLTRRGEATTLYGLPGEEFRGITHDITVDTGGGTLTWTEPEPVSWTGGTGQLLAVDDVDDDVTTKMYIQLLTGLAPTDGLVITGGTSGASNEVAPAGATPRTISTPFCGTSTGANIIGAYGFGIQYTDISDTDSITALDAVAYSPPNLVTFSITGLVSGEDYIFVGPLGLRYQYDAEATGPFAVGETVTYDTPGTAVIAQVIDWGTYGELITGPVLTGSVPADDATITSSGTATAVVNGTPKPDADLRQFDLNGLLSGSTTSVVVTQTIPADTPSSGTIRILRDNGVYTSHPYSTWLANTFTITSHDFTTDNALDDTNVFISYLDKTAAAGTESFQGEYTIDRDFFIRDRDGAPGSPIKTHEGTGQNSDTGGSASVTRTSDA
jgi:hypothetical protein